MMNDAKGDVHVLKFEFDCITWIDKIMAAIKISGRMVNYSRLTFESNDLDQIRNELQQLMADSGYRGTPIIIQSTVSQHLIELLQLLMEFELQPMAAIDGVLGDDARMIQFPVLPPDQPVQRIKASSVTEKAVESVKIPPVQVPNMTVYHDDILRTGQSLMHDHGDIVLTTSMNSGAELIASGNIYIFGVARGRIIAGASGEQNARIFCQNLEAELVSIAGTYCVADDIPKEFLKKPVQIFLNSKQMLEFEPLTF